MAASSARLKLPKASRADKKKKAFDDEDAVDAHRPLSPTPCAMRACE